MILPLSYMFDRVVLIGDPLQLEPLFKSNEIKNKNYNISLFEIIIQQKILEVNNIDCQ